MIFSQTWGQVQFSGPSRYTYSSWTQKLLQKWTLETSKILSPWKSILKTVAADFEITKILIPWKLGLSNHVAVKTEEIIKILKSLILVISLGLSYTWAGAGALSRA